MKYTAVIGTGNTHELLSMLAKNPDLIVSADVEGAFSGTGTITLTMMDRNEAIFEFLRKLKREVATK